MKKNFLNIAFIIFMAFFIPILFTNKFKIIETSTQDIDENFDKNINMEFNETMFNDKNGNIDDNFNNNAIIDTEENKIKKSLNYGDYSNIKLLHKLTGEVENINLDTYLYGVVAAEMPASYEIEALKAQAVVARTYTIYKVIHADKHDNADICDDSNCCQAWISKENRFARWDENECEKNWMKIVKAVDSTIR